MMHNRAALASVLATTLVLATACDSSTDPSGSLTEAEQEVLVTDIVGSTFGTTSDPDTASSPQGSSAIQAAVAPRMARTFQASVEGSARLPHGRFCIVPGQRTGCR